MDKIKITKAEFEEFYQVEEPKEGEITDTPDIKDTPSIPENTTPAYQLDADDELEQEMFPSEEELE